MSLDGMPLDTIERREMRELVEWLLDKNFGNQSLTQVSRLAGSGDEPGWLDFARRQHFKNCTRKNFLSLKRARLEIRKEQRKQRERELQKQNTIRQEEKIVAKVRVGLIELLKQLDKLQGSPLLPKLAQESASDVETLFNKLIM